MEITEEQRRRAEANRLAALDKRRRFEGAALSYGEWKLTKCQALSNPVLDASDTPPLDQPANVPPAKRDRFSVPVSGFPFPGEAECLKSIGTGLSSVPAFCYVEFMGHRKSIIYKLKDYELVLNCLRKLRLRLHEIPYVTRIAIEKSSYYSSGDRWTADRAPHLSNNEIDELLSKLPKVLKDALLPFQLEGVRFGLQRGGSCLIADEMGLGKTIQAIAIACCVMDKGPILIICPAILRFSWAEELEHWLPICLPSDIHLVFGHLDNIDRFSKIPKFVVISYTMLHRLRRSILRHKWALMIVDESHNIRCTKKASESEETKAILDLASNTERIVLLSGTPSLSRPSLLGKDKYEFANNYCSLRFVKGSQGRVYKDFSSGIRLEELNILLKQTVMIRRLKEHVLTQLPPKRRQVIRLMLKRPDILSAVVACRTSDNARMNSDGCFESEWNYGTKSDGGESHDSIISRDWHSKLSGFCEWFSSHFMVESGVTASCSDTDLASQKIVIFAHHIKVLDGIQDFICEKGIQFIRIDGTTIPRDRKIAVETFRLTKEVTVALIGITAGGVGLNFSAAQNVVFLELPRSASEMLQAEDRAHRHGQKNAVNIYIFCAKGTLDELHWLHLNKSLYRVSSMMNGKSNAIKEIEVDSVLHLRYQGENPYIVHPESSSDVIGRRHHTRSCKERGCTRWEGRRKGSKEVLTGGRKMRGVARRRERKGAVAGEGKRRMCSRTRREKISNGSQSWTPSRVSGYTGRIHLYVCVSGVDLRPKPLYVNFRPEELDSEFSPLDNKNGEGHLVKGNPAYWEVLKTFRKEWNGLRPVDQKNLLGKPLQLPLLLELCYLKESVNHGRGGLLRGGSKRRLTPFTEISHCLPEHGVWKKITLQRGPRRKKVYFQAWMNNVPLCKLCQSPCSGRLAQQPEFFEDLFCDLSCFQEYRTRTSQRFLREALFQIEHGICTVCKLDCHRLVERIRPLSTERRRKYISQVAPQVANKRKLLEKLANDPTEGNAWHADHIVPVYKGGGECRLENMRTLCVACHSDVTAAQQVERRLMQTRAKERLRIVMNELRGNKIANLKDGNEEEELFVKVPGSAYFVQDDSQAP
ncbi:unnamed protein product [Spirodela intermedia]|uniref:Uncharacterized protein n=1 Tax=Spirodela intermedia TaxID=51605 RepID=A0A7I8II77_SPIIN|nr:unnamed protein product [Spirodela intermedia]CAA6657426.1 unnamed protein product [Spirodela intermedia]